MGIPDYGPASTAKIEAAAADWLARCDAGLDPIAEADFQQWLGADPRHTAAWRELEATWQVFDLPRQRGQAAQVARALIARQRRRRRQAVLGSAAAITLAAAVVIVWVVRPFSSVSAPWSDSMSTGRVVVSRLERRSLADGSVVELDKGAQIEVHFSNTRRDVRLVEGKAHFEVAKDASRPFIVATQLAEVRAVGTAFAIGLLSQEVSILVTEGTVSVDHGPAAMPPRLPVPAGNLLIVPAAAASDSRIHIEPVTPSDIDRLLAWRAPRLELSNTPLSDVVTALNRENRVHLLIEDPVLARLRLSGMVRADRAEDFVRLLEANYGVRSERRGTNVIVLRRAT